MYDRRVANSKRIAKKSPKSEQIVNTRRFYMPYAGKPTTPTAPEVHYPYGAPNYHSNWKNIDKIIRNSVEIDQNKTSCRFLLQSEQNKALRMVTKNADLKTLSCVICFKLHRSILH